MTNPRLERCRRKPLHWTLLARNRDAGNPPIRRYRREPSQWMAAAHQIFHKCLQRRCNIHKLHGSRRWRVFLRRHMVPQRSEIVRQQWRRRVTSWKWRGQRFCCLCRRPSCQQPRLPGPSDQWRECPRDPVCGGWAKLQRDPGYAKGIAATGTA